MEFFTVNEAASLLKPHPETIRIHCKEGRLPGAFKLGGRGPWRIPAGAIEDLGKPPEPHPVLGFAPRNKRSIAQQEAGKRRRRRRGLGLP
uniref:helix-turn-helix domain-containing protein n=1 Tax=Brachybacterium sp. GPGPB12 TaxID=3023517 RepID=UPI00404964BF